MWDVNATLIRIWGLPGAKVSSASPAMMALARQAAYGHTQLLVPLFWPLIIKTVSLCYITSVSCQLGQRLEAFLRWNQQVW